MRVGRCGTPAWSSVASTAGAGRDYEEQAHELVDAKTEHTWLKEVPGHCLQQTLMDLDKACRKHGTFRVRWRSSRRWVPSARLPEGPKMKLKKLNRNNSRVQQPKLGWVKFRASRGLGGEAIRSATLSREGLHWYVSLLVDDGITAPAEHAAPNTAVGVDRGAVVAVATIAGELLDQAFTTSVEQRRALRLQRKLSRTAKRSANRNKARQRYAGLRAKEARRRQDFCVKTARQLAEENAVVVLEKLPTKNMTRRAHPSTTRIIQATIWLTGQRASQA
jgi:putative transposase